MHNIAYKVLQKVQKLLIPAYLVAYIKKWTIWG